MNGNLRGSAIDSAIFGGSFSGASLNASNLSINPRDPQAITLLFPPASASFTKMSTPSSTARVSIPAASNTASIEPRVAMPTSLQPVHPIATALHLPDAVNLAISASRIELAAA